MAFDLNLTVENSGVFRNMAPGTKLSSVQFSLKCYL